MENEFKDKLSSDPTLQAQVLDILKGTEVGKQYTETVAKNYFEQNIGQEHRKIYDFVDNAITSAGFDKPDGVKTSEWVKMIAQQNKELSDKVNSKSFDPNKLNEEIEKLTAKHKKEKQHFQTTAEQEIAKRDEKINNLMTAQTQQKKMSAINSAIKNLEFNKGLDDSLINDIVQVKTQILIQNSKIEDGAVVWCSPEGTPIKDGILNASLDTILKNEFSSVLHKSVAGGNAGTQPNTQNNFNGQQVMIDPTQFKTQEQFLSEFNQLAQAKGIAKGEQYDSLYWEAFDRYNVKQLKEF
jgi:uncharacterized protein Smg (DUF494 family)